MGFCMSLPVIVRPWDTIESALQSQDYYSAQPHNFHPLLGAPKTDARGGVIYFDSGNSKEEVLGAVRLMGGGMADSWRQFAVFVDESESAIEQGYISHCRLMPYGTLGHLYRASLQLVEGGAAPQPVSWNEVLWHFVQAEEERWGTGMGGDLSGCMGGDGDWAKESLCFGFMVENNYHSIVRIWSRAGLVTK